MDIVQQLRHRVTALDGEAADEIEKLREKVLAQETIISESAAPRLAAAVKCIDEHFEKHLWSDEVFKAWRLVRATLKMRGERLNERQDF